MFKAIGIASLFLVASLVAMIFLINQGSATQPGKIASSDMQMIASYQETKTLLGSLSGQSGSSSSSSSSGSSSASAPSSSGSSGASSSSSSGSAPSSSSSGASSATQKYMSIDQSKKTVTIKLIAGLTSACNGGFNFNGGCNGKMTVSVPQGWTVKVNFTNHVVIPHSAAVVAQKTAQTPVFSGAEVSHPTTGVPQGGSESFSFKTTKTGNFFLVCLVPGHVNLGMWDHFDVTASGTPSISG